jgi:predicted secreted protein
MAQEVGTNVLLQVTDDASPTNFVTVAGQQTTAFTGNTETDDITDKTQQGWGATMNVLVRGQVTVQGKAVWPDLTGIDTLRVNWQARTSLECRLLLNAAGAHYRGLFFVTQFNISGAFNTATEYDVQLDNAEALIYAAS